MQEKQLKTGFFDEAPGESSSTRLNSFIVLMVWVAIILFQVVMQGKFSGFEYHIVIATAAFAPKTVAKFAEMKTAKSSEPEKIEG